MKRENLHFIGESISNLVQNEEDKELFEAYINSKFINHMISEMDAILTDIEDLTFEDTHFVWAKITGYYVKLKEFAIKNQKMIDVVFGKENHLKVYTWTRFGILYEFQDKLFYNLNRKCLEYDSDMRILPKEFYNHEYGYNDIVACSTTLADDADLYITYAQTEGLGYFDRIIKTHMDEHCKIKGKDSKALYTHKVTIYAEDTPLTKPLCAEIEIMEGDKNILDVKPIII